jgi:hypothetical protein
VNSTPKATPDQFTNFDDDFWSILGAADDNFTAITGQQIPERHRATVTEVDEYFIGRHSLGGFTNEDLLCARFSDERACPQPVGCVSTFDDVEHLLASADVRLGDRNELRERAPPHQFIETRICSIAPQHPGNTREDFLSVCKGKNDRLFTFLFSYSHSFS